MLPFHGMFDNLAFQIEASKVTLFGQVPNPTLRTDAERLVKKVEGVESVENKIEVLPASPNDDRIRLAVYRAIYTHSTMTRYAFRAVPTIHIIVKNGHVSLEGTVAT
jgi:hyperosmotically inducible protein